ncbi:hypothetical protein [Flavitalea sp.]|nr:hypothetical protein [Flavitalea sp.]
MKKIIFITGLIIILAASGYKFTGIGETSSINNIQDENLVLNYDASLAANKKLNDPNKHSSCRHYHKKKYE